MFIQSPSFNAKPGLGTCVEQSPSCVQVSCQQHGEETSSVTRTTETLTFVDRLFLLYFNAICNGL